MEVQKLARKLTILDRNVTKARHGAASNQATHRLRRDVKHAVRQWLVVDGVSRMRFVRIHRHDSSRRVPVGGSSTGIPPHAGFGPSYWVRFGTLPFDMWNHPPSPKELLTRSGGGGRKVLAG